MEDDEGAARSRDDQRRGQPDRITDAIARHPFVAIPFAVAAIVLGGTVKVLSAEGSEIPWWLALSALVLGVPLFAWMGWRAYLWLQRQRSDADGSLHVSEERPSDRPSPD